MGVLMAPACVGVGAYYTAVVFAVIAIEERRNLKA
jgi:hypothetical protein